MNNIKFLSGFVLGGICIGSYFLGYIFNNLYAYVLATVMTCIFLLILIYESFKE